MSEKSERMTLRELLEERLPQFSSPAERQRSFIWRQNSIPAPCPNCAASVNVIEAGNLDLDEVPPDLMNDEEYCCPTCERRLRFVVPFFPTGRAWYLWRLVPERI